MIAEERSDSEPSEGGSDFVEEERQAGKAAKLETTSLGRSSSPQSSSTFSTTAASATVPMPAISTDFSLRNDDGSMFWIIYAISALLMISLIILVNVNVFITLLGIGLIFGALIKAASCWRARQGRRRAEYASI